MDLFEKAMKEYNQNNPVPRKKVEKICYANNFYDAMKAYIHNKTPKKYVNMNEPFTIADGKFVPNAV